MTRRVACRRRGSLFNYYLVYLLLTGSVMAAVGVSMHAVLKSDQNDSVMALQLLSLRNMEQDFRRDVENAVSTQFMDGALVCVMPDQNSAQTENSETTAVWTTDSAVVRRAVRRDGKEIQRGRYVFHDAIAELVSHKKDEVAVRITGPGAQAVEIRMFRPAMQGVTP